MADSQTTYPNPYDGLAPTTVMKPLLGLSDASYPDPAAQNAFIPATLREGAKAESIPYQHKQANSNTTSHFPPAVDPA